MQSISEASSCDRFETTLITGLNGRTLFNNYVIGINNKDYETDKDTYAIVYINIVHFAAEY